MKTGALVLIIALLAATVIYSCKKVNNSPLIYMSKMVGSHIWSGTNYTTLSYPGGTYNVTDTASITILNSTTILDGFDNYELTYQPSIDSPNYLVFSYSNVTQYPYPVQYLYVNIYYNYKTDTLYYEYLYENHGGEIYTTLTSP